MDLFEVGDRVTWTKNNSMERRYGVGPFIVKALKKVPYELEDSMCKHCGFPMCSNGSFSGEDAMDELSCAPLGCNHEEDGYSTYGGYRHPHWIDLERLDECDARPCPHTVIGVHLRHWTKEDQQVYDRLNTFPVRVAGIRRW